MFNFKTWTIQQKILDIQEEKSTKNWACITRLSSFSEILENDVPLTMGNFITFLVKSPPSWMEKRQEKNRPCWLTEPLWIRMQWAEIFSWPLRVVMSPSITQYCILNDDFTFFIVYGLLWQIQTCYSIQVPVSFI